VTHLTLVPYVGALPFVPRTGVGRRTNRGRVQIQAQTVRGRDRRPTSKRETANRDATRCVSLARRPPPGVSHTAQIDARSNRRFTDGRAG